MRKILTYLFIFHNICFAQLHLADLCRDNLQKIEDEDEALFIRRVFEFYRDEDFELARRQIQIFDNTYPNSLYRDTFCVMRAEMALREQDYPSVITALEAIKDESLRKEVRNKRWKALYHMQDYGTLYHEISPIQLFLSEQDYEARFYLAEAAFREGMLVQTTDEAASLFEEALPLYHALSHHHIFGGHAKLATAEIYRQLDYPKEAAKIYLEIAGESHDDEELLFHAAIMLSQFDERRATEIYRRLAYDGEKLARESAYQWMQLLAKGHRWAPLFEEKALFLSRLSNDKLPLYHFYVGMVDFDKKQWKKAAEALNLSLEKGLEAPHDRGALTALAVCGKERTDTETVERAYQWLHERYPEQMGEVPLIRAIAYQQAGYPDLACIFYEELLETCDDPALLEQGGIHHIRLLLEGERWSDAYDRATSFLAQFPGSPQANEMHRLRIDLALKQLHEEVGYDHLRIALESALEIKELFSTHELLSQQKLLAKTYLKLDCNSAAYSMLEHLLPMCGEDSELHYLATLYHLKEGNSPEKVVEHGERALTLNPYLPEKERLHLYLFNAYLEMARRMDDEYFTTFAEDHLYEVINIYPVSLENRLWLADRYTKQRVRHARAVEVYEGLLDTEAQLSRFPKEVVRLISLYDTMGEHRKENLLIDRFLATSPPQPEREEAELFQAHVMLEREYYKEAATLLGRLEGSDRVDLKQRARLYLARLHFATLPRFPTADEVEGVTKQLRLLWIQKNAEGEPLHLEAALDYAMMEARCQRDERFEKAYLKNLKEMQEEFSQRQDIASKDYHLEIGQSEEKQRLYTAYMQFAEAKIMLLEGKKEEGKKLLLPIVEGEMAETRYLVEKARAELYDRS